MYVLRKLLSQRKFMATWGVCVYLFATPVKARGKDILWYGEEKKVCFMQTLGLPQKVFQIDRFIGVRK